MEKPETTAGRLPGVDVPLSVFDLTTVREDGTAADALREAVTLARRVDQLGYHRYWVAEHHNAPTVASSAPAVLIARLAAATERIRVGSGAVILPNHPPLVVAEQFDMLEAFHPGRIDLGLGRGPGTDPATAALLRRGVPLEPESYERDLDTLLELLADRQPEVWLLGSSAGGAMLAARLGLPFAFAQHIRPDNLTEAVTAYRENFRPSGRLDRPYLMVALAAICAETDERAERLAQPSLLTRLRIRDRKVLPLPSGDTAAGYPYTADEWRTVRQIRDSYALGSPETVRAQLTDLVQRTGADELMLETMVYDPHDRIRSFELIAG
ncbi:LLM class flavin-dependent oxidoreductase [Micromonospora sp. NPDC050397]|uniref:LLM class flavin-dependent oxidoreductase n=1 Tax=Micromonospora sp. NPDC050397 TaxID=3364279 RepID=UPI0038515C84